MFFVIELMIAINFRSLRYSIFSAPPHKWLILAIFWEAVLMIVLLQVPAVRESFGIGMPTFMDIGLIMAYGFFIMAVLEIYKLWLRRHI